jgi:CRP-like cAMP-binding protein
MRAAELVEALGEAREVDRVHEDSLVHALDRDCRQGDSSRLTDLAEAATRVLGPMVPGFSFRRWASLRTLAVRRLRAREGVFAEGDVHAAFYGVVDGEMGLVFATESGAESVIELVGPPTLFGWSAFATARSSTFEARSTRKSELLVIGTAAYAALLTEVPGFAVALLNEVARRHGDLLAQLHAARHRSAEERLRHAIAGLARSARAVVQARGLLLRVSQAELAEAASLSRQATNEILRRWVKAGIAQCGYRKIWIARPDRGR